MGKKSVKENKNIYQISREDAGLTREKASECMFMSSDRIEKIESEKSMPHPDEILEMEKCYKVPTLSNYYCTHECPIGKKYIPEIKSKNLSEITLETLASLNALEEARNRFIDITVDGKITDDEMPDFTKIRAEMEKISSAVDSLRLWLDKQIIENGKK